MHDISLSLSSQTCKPEERVVDTLLQTIGKDEQPTLAPISQIKREPNTTGGSSKFQLASELAT